MKNKEVISKVLALVGTVLVLFPVLFMLTTSLFGSLGSGQFQMDFLLPGELGFLILLGAGLLLWSAWPSKPDRKRILFWIVAALASLVVGIAVAVISGANNNPENPTGILLYTLAAFFILYDLSTVEIGVAGILHIVKLFKRDAPKE
jgi:FtsH-binding integral membrane protein